jgi:hypothetical protein
MLSWFHARLLGVVKLLEKFLLILGGESLFGHCKQNVILFVDMLPQKIDVRPGMLAEGIPGLRLARTEPLEGLGHAPHMAPPHLMLIKHHPNRPAFMRKSFPFHGREQEAFLFAMVAAVGKAAEKLDRLFGVGLWERVIFRPVAELFQYGEHLLNDPVL